MIETGFKAATNRLLRSTREEKVEKIVPLAKYFSWILEAVFTDPKYFSKPTTSATNAEKSLQETDPTTIAIVD